MQNILLFVHLLIAMGLIGLVLMQRSEGGALGMGGGSNALMTGRSAADVLARGTMVLAGLFFVTSLSLSVLAGGHTQRKSVLDAAPAETAQPAPAAPIAPPVRAGPLAAPADPAALPTPAAAVPAPAASEQRGLLPPSGPAPAAAQTAPTPALKVAPAPTNESPRAMPAPTPAAVPAPSVSAPPAAAKSAEAAPAAKPEPKPRAGPDE